MPMTIHEIAHLLDQFGHEMRGWRRMSALADIDGTWPKYARIGIQTVEGFAMQRQDMRRSEFEGAALDVGKCELFPLVCLGEAVADFEPGDFHRIG